MARQPRHKTNQGRHRGGRPKPPRLRGLGSAEPLRLEQLEPRLVLSPIISEFLASNTDPIYGLRDFQGELHDWIEIYNPDAQSVDLTGWKLRDSGKTWTFPAFTLGPNQYQIVFASDKNLTSPELHTNFKLSRDPGEYLGLLDNLGQVVHEYSPSYPGQRDNISYGIGQQIEETKLVGAGVQTRYFVPTDDLVEQVWMLPGFDDSAWAHGPTGLGFAGLVPGFAVWNYKASVTVSDLNTALSVIGNPAYQSAVYTETASVVNYLNTGGSGHFTSDAAFPNMAIGTDYNDFVVQAKGILRIPTTGAWTFGVNSDDGFRLKITGATFNAAYGAAGTTVNGDTLEYAAPRAPNDSFGVINSLAAGDYDVELTFYERGGGSCVELFAAPGAKTGWDSSFRLVGDTASGGLVVMSEPFVGSGSPFASLIRTNVKEAMLSANNASLYTRIAFDVPDPQSLHSLTLKMKYDDGYVAYLNGVEIARRNAPATVQYNSQATAERTDSQAIVFENVDVSQHLGLLQTTGNVLAIQAMNYSPSDGDMLVLPELAQIIYQGAGEHYFATPTPGAANCQEYWYRVEQPEFSVEHGFYTQAFALTLTTPTAGATIRYSLNGTTPTEADNTKSVTSITRTGSTATATIPSHGYANGDWVLIRGADQPEYNGVFVIADVTADTFTYAVPGSPATPATGTITAQANYYTYTGPLTIDRTTTVRAAAFKTACEPSKVATQTYIFTADVIQQSRSGAAPPGWPTGPINSQVLDYGMDYNVVDDPTWGPQVEAALKAIPTMSLVTDLGNLFDPATGIYVNAWQDGPAWERPTSVELIYPDGTEGFQVNAGLRIRGGYSRSGNNPKHAFRLLFKAEYGDSKLRYPLFGDEGVDEFDNIDLRCSQNYSWSFGGDPNNAEIREVFARDTQGALGQPYTRSRFYHLYINGQYWGLYQTEERPEASYAASYFGGNEEDYDVIKVGDGYNIVATDGDMVAWQELWNLTKAGFATDEAYYHVQGLDPVTHQRDPNYPVYIDVANLIDYMLIIFFGGDMDAPISNFLGNNSPNNWYGIRNRDGQSGFKFFIHDAEHTLSRANAIAGGDANRTGPYPAGWTDVLKSNPQMIHQELMAHPDYRMLFADRAHKYLTHNGLMTAALETDPARQRFLARAEELGYSIPNGGAMVAESARWGDSKREPPLTKNNWLNAVNNELNSFLPNRASVLINQLKNARMYAPDHSSTVPAPLYPSLDAPEFNQFGGLLVPGFQLTMSGSGTIYYSLDGTDPRLPGGAVNPSPSIAVYSGPIPLSDTTHVKARALLNGQWSALSEATFYMDLAPSMRITEIMYNPPAPSAAEIAAGYTDNEDFEFLEIKNIGTQTLDLGGLRLSQGIDLTFPQGVSIAPGEYKVVVRNSAAFLFRYSGLSPSIIAGVYSGKLDNAGEQIELDAPVGGAIHLFAYQDGWYDHTDGEGFSLCIRDPLGPLEAWNTKAGWRASAAPGGTPGWEDTLPNPGSVIINEVLAHQDAPPGDMIELYNTTDQAIDIGGWFLSDAKEDLTKYQIAAGTSIQPHGYLVLTEGANFGPGSGDPGSRVPFALSEHGDDLYLCSNASGLAGGYREHVDFGASPNGVPVGLYVKSTGGTDFTLLETPTFGAGPNYPGGPNSAAYRGALVINEIMYHPAGATPEEIAAGYDTDDFEFVELYNRSGTTQTLQDFYLGNGIGFTFGWYPADGFGRESWTLEPGATATWSTSSLENATYEVFARYDLYNALNQKRDLDDAAQYRITHAAGTTLVTIDQDDDLFTYTDPDGWVFLGTFNFNGSGTVVLARGTDGPQDWTLADQVRFKRAGHEVVVDDPVLASPWTSSGPTSLGPGAYLVLVRNYAAFDSRYDILGNNIPVAGTYSGKLANNGDAIKLFGHGTADPASGYLPWYRLDYVHFDDHTPWPAEPDGTGSSLNRLNGESYGNDPANWEAGNVGGTPGLPNVLIDRTPPSAPSGLAGQVTVNPDKITLRWTAAVDPDTYVHHYIIYRDNQLLGTSTATSYEDTAVVPLKPYTYEVSAVNRDGYEGARSSPVVVTVPGIVNYAMPEATQIELYFTEPLDPATATVAANYVLDPGALESAALSADGLKVTLTTAQPLQNGMAYTVTTHDLTTLSGNEIRDGLSVTFTYAPVGSGYILREYWLGISGTLVRDLTNNPNYPDNFTGKTYPTSLEAPTNFGDNYGTRIRGYVHPPTSGYYIFWVASSDSSELWLSTDEDPAHTARIAGAPSSTGWRVWTTFASQQSAPVWLMAGRRYYIEVLHKEGTGSDYVAVRWQLPGGVWENPSDPNLPIPAARLSQWGPVPDTSPPTMPAGLSAQVVSGTQVDLDWLPAADPESGVHHYTIYRDGQPYATTTTTSFSDTGATRGVRHRYQVSASNPFYFEGSRSATLSVAPAGMVSAAALDATTVQVLFTEPMDPARAQEPTNYALSGGKTVLAAALQPDRLTVHLTTSSLTLGTTYTLTVNNLRTAAGVDLPANLQTSFYYGNGILWEYWLNIGSGTAVRDLTSNPNYPYNPSGREYRTSFEARTNWNDYYGARMRGYLTPTTTGDYWFWIASDDNGELWLSTNDNPANKTRIAYVPGWTSSRQWAKYAEQKSALISLVAGTRYYVEALMKEGAGGDNLAVAWQPSGGTFQGPIPGSFLTPYVETFNTLSLTPAIESRVTADPTPELHGTVSDANVAITLCIAGRYYAATRNSSTTWVLPDNVIQPPLEPGTHDIIVCATDVAGRTAFDTTTDELSILLDATPPSADIVDVVPDPRTTAV
ncbi:MAG: lamin tail domain-containing protein, partial [Thermoguttaceae bacterium]